MADRRQRAAPAAEGLRAAGAALGLFGQAADGDGPVDDGMNVRDLGAHLETPLDDVEDRA